ncbi:hypothetical protein PAPYR_9930 [Paratrimastix pyriformis]|uniref:Uncharacterized protein n=1 Tax=Paratrimastix pyriformis TaxID=342808 RepID=A0ABQ8U9U7_9EUKA|nr:hypothetical protein PAPYR_9930 [Paratrimastix pyriformis]
MLQTCMTHTHTHKEENPAVGDNLKGHRWATPAGWGTDTEEENPKRDNLKKEENPAEGDNLMREGAEENPDFGENLDGGMEDHAGDGNAAQAGDIRGILPWLRWLGLASFWLTCSWDREVWKGRQAKISWMQVIMYAWGDLEGLACQANWKFIVDRLKRWVGMKEGRKRGRGDIDLVEFLKKQVGLVEFPFNDDDICEIAGSRLVLLRTKQIATQSLIPEFSIFSSKKTASSLSTGAGFNELWKRSALFLGTVGGALWLTRTRFRATSVVHYRDLPLMYRLALGVSSGSPP